MVEFNNIEPWFDRFPRVELQTTDGLFDLHNNAELLAVSFQISPPVLLFEFRYAQNWEELEHPSAGSRVVLRFSHVADLLVKQAGGYDPRAASTLEGIEHIYEAGASMFSIDAGDVVTTFRARSIYFSTDP